MRGMAPSRIVAFGLLASCVALCQQSNVQTNRPPEAPPAQNGSAQTAKTQSLLEVFDAVRLPIGERAKVGAATAGRAAQFDLRYFDRQQPDHNGSRKFLAKQIVASTLSQSNSHPALGGSLIRRAGCAGLSIILTHDDAGKRRLNTSYLLRVLTTAAAHSAYVPYWRRSLSQPAGNFGSTIGNDAGMKVFHEFKPEILQLVKSHEPKFVYAIRERIGNN
jgi:hypothetical protein